MSQVDLANGLHEFDSKASYHVSKKVILKHVDPIDNALELAH